MVNEPWPFPVVALIDRADGKICQIGVRRVAIIECLPERVMVMVELPIEIAQHKEAHAEFGYFLSVNCIMAAVSHRAGKGGKGNIGNRG